MINVKKRIKVLKAIDVSSIYQRVKQCNYTKFSNLNQKSNIVNRKLIYLCTTKFLYNGIL